jgi:hypothetical protein
MSRVLDSLTNLTKLNQKPKLHEKTKVIGGEHCLPFIVSNVLTNTDVTEAQRKKGGREQSVSINE